VRWDGVQLVNPRDGECNPAAMVGALARQARTGSIREGVEVSELWPRRHGVLVTAGPAQCEAGVVILATNAYTPRLVPSVKIQPMRAQMLATSAQSREVIDRPVYSQYGFRYWRQLKSGEVLVGGWRDTSPDSEMTDDDEPTEEIQEHLERGARELGAIGEITHRWAGTMGFTETGLPLAGPLEGMANVYICAGFTGHGMGFAFMTAKQVVEGI
jgi:glycine/D-amino acid oxidase-like deaminating enzyme